MDINVSGLTLKHRQLKDLTLLYTTLITSVLVIFLIILSSNILNPSFEQAADQSFYRQAKIERSIPFHSSSMSLD
jgi:sensor domain CHASE-containing protein